ncbi:MAG: septum formation inhibitor Maf [Thiothrix sp.]|nr:septum formation inhibitor Maf [Thiothrix sp.]HPQ96503.1 nucleoside triphosphate pyrophosphatase [Thiolinea sp.]
MGIQVMLASGSPRRRELLDQIGIRYRVQTADVDESAQAGETPEALVLRLARAKAQAVWDDTDRTLPVLGADTLGVVDGILLVKPDGFESARAMLKRMSGRMHEVLTAVALCSSQGTRVRLNRSRVWFRELAEAEILAYWAQGEPRDKAGAYAVQGLGAVFVERLEGSYSGVMGLPLFETAQLLATAGIFPLPPAQP